MAKFGTISPTNLMRLIGTPAAPVVLDVRLDEDIGSIPVFVPASRAVSHLNVGECAGDLCGRPVVVVCHKGLKLSHGAAAVLRARGVQAQVLEGGATAWADAGLPALPKATLPEGMPGTLWVTRHRPKIDRIACPWLIRRFIDPEARFLFVPAGEVLAVAERFSATAFDVPGAPWTHHDGHCTFDSLLSGFNLHTQALNGMARVIRGADTNDHALAPECAGLLAFSVGLSRAYSDDLAQLDAGMLLYDCLYRWARDGNGESHDRHGDAG